MVSTSPFPRGSEWRIWDLHVHTPASPGYKGTFDELVSGLAKCEAGVVGLNDYASLQGFVEVLRRGGVVGKSLLPVVELRMHNIVSNRKSAQAGAFINFHVVFNNEPNIVKQAVNFINSLECYNSDGKGDLVGNIQPQDLLKVTVDFDKVIGKLKKLGLGEDTLIWLPYDEYGGIDDIDPTDNFFKLHLLKKAHIIGSSTRKQIDFFLWNDTKFQVDQYRNWFEKRKPCIKGSDAHEANYPVGRLRDQDSKPTKRHCWIKADPTFEGLKQIVFEPENRVFIGEIPPKLELLQKAPERFIDSITVVASSDDGEWFDQIGELKLNCDLVSIIGNKGNGKSALADIISSAGNSDNTSYSFLRGGKFLDLDARSKYTALLRFRNSSQCTKAFDSPDFEPGFPSKVVYLSQSFVEDLCGTEDSTRLQDEIDRVVYSHIPREERQDLNDLGEVISLKTSRFNDQLDEKRDRMHALNEKIIQYEEYQKPAFRVKMENGLKDKENELKLTQLNEKPLEVRRPDKAQNEETAKRLEMLRAEQKQLGRQIESNQIELNGLVSDKNELRSVRDSIDDLRRRIVDLTEELAGNLVLQKYGIQAGSLLRVVASMDPVAKVLESVESALTRVREEKSKSELRVNDIGIEMTQLSKNLSDQERAYEAYLALVESWELKQNRIIGKSEEPQTIAWFKNWLDFLDKRLAPTFESLERERNQLANEIVRLLFDRSVALEDVYGHTQDYADLRGDEFGIPESEFIDFDASILISKSFPKSFLDLVNQNRKGTFYGTEEGRAALISLLQKVDSEDKDQLARVPLMLIEALQHNLSADSSGQDPQFDTDLDSQVASKIELYDYLFSFSYLTANFEITYAGKSISSLSPGEKGTLLLIFYLLVDKDNRPIIIDQPDENLDNETVYTRLVPFFRRAKHERQVIIVTHNPNLAVVCDSEQIVHCSIDKESNNLVRYSRGSIEYSQIRTKVIDVLEGTKPAFKNRQDKYAIA